MGCFLKRLSIYTLSFLMLVKKMMNLCLVGNKCIGRVISRIDTCKVITRTDSLK